MVNNTTRPRRTGSVKQSSDVRYSDRGFAYAELGSTREIIGLVPQYSNADRPEPGTVPPGVLIYNTDTQSLELSDVPVVQWIQVSASGTFSGTTGSGSDISLGTPTDGNFSDGAVTLTPTGSISDAIDAINEYLLTITLSGSGLASGALNDTLRWNGTAYVPNSSLKADSTDVSILNRLTISGSIVIPAGTTPVTSGSAGTQGEIRYSNTFLYIKTGLGWARSSLSYF